MKLFLGKAMLFLVGLLAISVAFQRADTYSDIDIVGPKIHQFAAHKDEYDTVFIGSSYVYREIAPSLFDRLMGERGIATHSFNMGIPGMDPPETYFLAEQVLAARPQKLKYLIVELDYYERLVRNRTLHTRRFDYWHTPNRTAEVARALSESSVPRTKQLKDAGRHAEAGVRKFLNVGRGRTFLESLEESLGLTEFDLSTLGPDRDGFRALDDEDSQMWEARAGIFEAFEEGTFEEKTARLRQRLANPDGEKSQVTKVDADALRGFLEKAHTSGVRVVMIVPPCLMPRLDLIALRDQGVIDELFVFNDPDRYPQFYDLSVRFDPGHLNKRGATLFTEALATRFADLLAKNP